MIVGTDERGQEESPLSVLKALRFPSERLYDPSLPVVEYAPLAPLDPPGVTLNPTPEEAAAAERLTQLADQWRAGTVSNEELVEAAREALDPLAGKTPSGALASRRPTLPRLPPDAKVLTPVHSGTPVIGSPSGAGPVAILPSSPQASEGPKGNFTFWGRARVFDANGKEVWSDGFSEEGQSALDGSESERIKASFDRQKRALEADMIGVQRSIPGSQG